MACQDPISRVWGCAGLKFPFQGKQGQKQKLTKEGKQLAYKTRVADSLVQAFLSRDGAAVKWLEFGQTNYYSLIMTVTRRLGVMGRRFLCTD